MYTQGKWEVIEDSVHLIIRGGSGGYNLAFLYPIDGEQEKANAKLIASAPDLLAACEVIMQAESTPSSTTLSRRDCAGTENQGDKPWQRVAPVTENFNEIAQRKSASS